MKLTVDKIKVVSLNIITIYCCKQLMTYTKNMGGNIGCCYYSSRGEYGSILYTASLYHK